MISNLSAKYLSCLIYFSRMSGWQVRTQVQAQDFINVGNQNKDVIQEQGQGTGSGQAINIQHELGKTLGKNQKQDQEPEKQSKYNGLVMTGTNCKLRAYTSQREGAVKVLICCVCD